MRVTGAHASIGLKIEEWSDGRMVSSVVPKSSSSQAIGPARFIVFRDLFA